MTDTWTSRLSDYLNDDLAAADRVALEAHLDGCPDCRAAVAQLRHLAAWAGSYPGRPPREDAWPAIANAIRRSPRPEPQSGRARPPRRRIPWFPSTVPQVLAAGIALTAVAGGSFWLARQTGPASPEMAPAAWTPPTRLPADVAILATQKYSKAIAELEHALLAGDRQLDSATVRFVRDKLAVVERAIEEARDALARDPNSDYLADHFANMMRKKLALLRNVARS